MEKCSSAKRTQCHTTHKHTDNGLLLGISPMKQQKEEEEQQNKGIGFIVVREDDTG